MQNIGDKAPDFTLPRDGGGTVTLSDLQPSKVVVFFYPNDDTPGCTVESLAFTALKDAFAAADTIVLGISKNSVASHDKFRDKFDLQVALLSDADSDVCERYGVWAEKNNFGKKSMGIVRGTWLIDGAGNAAEIWTKVKAEGHAEEVLTAAQAL